MGRHIEYEEPAWKGTLNSTGNLQRHEHRIQHMMPVNGARSGSPSNGRISPYNAQNNVMSPVQSQPHQPRLQTMTYSGGNAPVYSQHSNPPPSAAPNATAQHLQYNSPLGLYSRDNVNQAINAQTAGMPGEGTIQVTGGGPQKQKDFSNSDLARMIQQEDQMAAGRQRAPSPLRDSARNTLQPPGQEPQYAGYVDQGRQSPSMFALQQHVLEQDAYAQGGSDF